jgi:hypothetical protein
LVPREREFDLHCIHRRLSERHFLEVVGRDQIDQQIPWIDTRLIRQFVDDELQFMLSAFELHAFSMQQLPVSFA